MDFDLAIANTQTTLLRLRVDWTGYKIDCQIVLKWSHGHQRGAWEF